MDGKQIFNIESKGEFDVQALKVFRHQYDQNEVYREFCSYLGKSTENVGDISEIPFLPISFFKSKEIISGKKHPEAIFTSSGTTGSQTSKHIVNRIALYEQSFRKAFSLFYGNIEDYCVLALLPSYLEREGSSLIYMVDDMIQKSKHPDSGFYLHDLDGLREKLIALDASGQKVLLIGVSFALLDMTESHSLRLNHTIVMETGGMKGRRKELIREELHHILKKGFGVQSIHSEYGMTELLSQGYSKGNGIFETPPWMKILIRDTEDPLTYQGHQKTGGINVIDLANIDSCAFIATQDLGKTYTNGSFEVLGRFDHSDVRGCNLMVL
ncbi:acyl transferase [Zobellia galactanivorans]|uniref:LuxE/PaaK family acyltransferase n=1 Tax=Zobellia galactanivorans (strain DSM 12802 / CCUG 47099 / CIP 106680 / NCIMB 13871 / Dsij) TaxID=63186 RepID=UPI001C07BA15|nr:acyl transferase [Zobellia galactanivorans]MBU3028164.1 acyl transferase [Zobellia galactanivorans]